MKDQLTAGGTIRVFVADDTRIHTQLLADVLRRDGGLQVLSSDSGFERSARLAGGCTTSMYW